MDSKGTQPYIRTCVHSPPKPLPSRLPYDMEQSSLRYTVGPCWLSILNSAGYSRHGHEFITQVPGLQTASRQCSPSDLPHPVPPPHTYQMGLPETQLQGAAKSLFRTFWRLPASLPGVQSRSVVSPTAALTAQKLPTDLSSLL